MDRRLAANFGAFALAFVLSVGCTDTTTTTPPERDVPLAEVLSDAPPPDGVLDVADAGGPDATPTDTAPTDGPPTACGMAGQSCCPGDVCGAGLACCAGACVDTARSAEHCGACGRPCNLPGASASCAAGACAIARCEPGFGDCDTTASNGCETNLSTASANCGACARACSAGEVCAAGSCQTACSAGQTNCAGSCVDTQTDAMHCGMCGHPCSLPNATEACTAGVCAVARCDTGFGDCDGMSANGCEVDLQTDVGACGACGRTCAGGQVCAAGVCRASCPAGTTACGAACVSLQTNAAHCGACGRACAPANGVGACVAGACTVARCLAGFGNCDANAANGCETNVTNTPTHCGACGRACAPANGVGACTAGACTVARCNAGFGDCDANAANGCETATATSLAHCGACGRACALPNATAACTAGACTLGVCATGFGNCDANATNGCETNLTNTPTHCGACGRACATGQVCAAGACVTTCPSGQTACAGRCVSLQTDVNHCGACGRVCNLANANESCAAGVCGIAGCLAGFGNCDANAANGCETNTNTTPASCGACGRACAPANANESCAAGVCGVASCLTGFGNCDANATNGCETNTNTTPASCGACGRACNLANANESCAAGVCGIASCLAGFGNCDGNAANGCETNLNTTPAHCGACGRACSTGQTCSAGVCTTACLSPLTVCAGRCVNTQTDAANCGMCGRVCTLTNATAVCTAGACTVGRCTPGFADCDGNSANGCEVNLTTSPANCGMCGRVCRLANATAGCAASTCTVASCNAGFADCDTSAANGCEVDTRTNLNHCGACGRVCNLANANESCAAGVCGIASCLASFGNCDANAANGCETNLLTSTTNCGTCGRPCGVGQTCASGTCASACGALGQVCCSTAPICSVGDRCSSPGPGNPTVCCNNRNRPCANDDQCCGQMLCNTTAGTCACRPYGAPCASLLDCCGIGSDPYYCDITHLSGGQTVCCKPPLFPCAADGECCGNSRCVGGTCACLGPGASCTSAECCLPLVCGASGRCA